MTTVFIGIPTFNRPDLVIETIESVRRQSYPDFRVVVSDNCSDGAAAARVKRYVESLGDGRFSFHQQSTNGGEYGQGRYFMAAAADARYMMILHDDDLLSPHYLSIAVAALDERPESALFVANSWLIDGGGAISEERTRQYLEQHGRSRMRAGAFAILDLHLAFGFTPISGTLFRRSALLASGFVDPEATGNFPFECDIFLRLGDIRAQGWFCPSQLMFVRYHGESLRNTLQLMDNPHVVNSMLHLFGTRRYRGWRERRRKVLMARLYRARALIHLRDGDVRQCRKQLRIACQLNPASPNAWGTRMLAYAAPRRLRNSLPVLDLPDWMTSQAPAAASGSAPEVQARENVFS